MPRSVCPPELLHAVSQQRGLVVLVVGAGCSVEAPTGLKLSREYAEDAYRRLVLDGLLEEGECLNPGDLSLLASAVQARHGTQAPVVERLPRAQFRNARPNDGYLTAAALLREKALNCVMTLNFDLAMSAALVQLSADEVAVIAGPSNLLELGASAVIYLHRNVDEVDPELWILRQEALEEEWRDGWQEVVARRVMAAPVTVFIGLGSPAAVLTETIVRIRAAVSGAFRAYAVDPAADSAFREALALPAEAHIQAGWGDFMVELGVRVAAEHCATMREACHGLCVAHDWEDEEVHAAELCSRFAALGLVVMGKLRASWLLAREAYVPDDPRRDLVADLLIAIGLVERELVVRAVFRDDGAVELRRDDTIVAVILPASGGGTQRWTAVEPRVRGAVAAIGPDMRPTHALVGGVQGVRPETVTPPEDVILGERLDSIVTGHADLEILSVDELRSDPASIRRMASG